MNEARNIKRPPPRPPKSQYLLSKEAELLAKSNHNSHIPSSYPKGFNPFGESSDDEVEPVFLPQKPSAPSLSESHVDKNPSPESGSENERSKEIDLKQDEVPHHKINDITPPNAVPVTNNDLPPNPFEGCDSEEELEEIEKKEDVKEVETVPVVEIVSKEPVSSNPFDETGDEEEDDIVKVKPPVENEQGKRKGLLPPRIPSTPPRRRQAPQPPVMHGSSPGLSQPLHSVAVASSPSPMLLREYSTSCESVRRKPPAPPQPVGQKREIRAEGFVKYPKLRREIEEVNGRLTSCDEDIEALRAKIEAGERVLLCVPVFCM